MQELKSRFYFNHFDYRYLCENSNVPLHTFSYAQYFLLAERIPRSFKKIIRGVVYYTGVVELTLSDKKSLLKDGSVRVNTAFLTSLRGIQTLESCSKDLLNQHFGDNFTIEYASSTSELDLSQCDAMVINDEHRELLHQKHTPLPTGIDITFDDLVIKAELIEWCKIQLNVEKNISSKREHSMKEQIKILQRENPNLSGTRLYKLVLENFENDIDSTDPLSILISIDRDEIIWGKAGQNEYTMSKKRFLNICSELKNTN